MEKYEALLVEFDKKKTLMEILITWFRMKWNICVGVVVQKT